jgi:hypothetical protein
MVEMRGPTSTGRKQGYAENALPGARALRAPGLQLSRPQGALGLGPQAEPEPECAEFESELRPANGLGKR